MQHKTIPKMTYLVLVLLVIPFASLGQSLTFTLNPQDDPIWEVSERFLSVALDSSGIERRYSDFNFSDPYLTKLVSHLSPMYFRIGGTYADRTIFSEAGSTENIEGNRLGIDNITFLASDWLKLYEFTQNANVRLIYDLNSLLRNQDGTWNSENAEQMIKFSNENRMDLDWELGNEPDLYGSIYSTNVDASQLARDLQKLRNILNQYEIYKSSVLVGNDMFDVGGNQNNQHYLSTYLEGAANAIYAVTWHHYYFAGRDATEQIFLSPDTFNYLEQRTNVVKNIVSQSGAGNKIWLGETSSAYNGGAANMSDRYIGTFLWLDKLGLGAKLGLDVIIRQTIFVDNYALLDNDYVPNPDWWISVLYKKLVGTKVLSLSNNGTSSNTVRLYAHCAKKNELWDSSAVVVFGFNVAAQTATANLEGLNSSSAAFSYEFTYDSNLYSKSILLNGEVLTVSSEGDLPEFVPKSISTSGLYEIEPYSIVFWIFLGANVNACNN